ncbi:MAG: NAD(P)-binding domain-containing protein [Propionibacteriaceae bacterium]|nr:NAD(P)-binding domain-containing protein [Propionibacteriaceae bacterium]
MTDTVRRCAVLGSPIAHSLSPRLHRAAYAWLGLNWQYERHQLTVAELPAFRAGLDDRWRGLSCTMPLKSAIVDWGQPDDIVRSLGVANTVIFDGSPQDPATTRIRNTDVTGLMAIFRSAGSAPGTGGGVEERAGYYAETADGDLTDVQVRQHTDPAGSDPIDVQVHHDTDTTANALSVSNDDPVLRTDQPEQPPIRSALVVGTGATATSALYAMARSGCTQAQVVGRNAQAIDHLTAAAESWGLTVTGRSFDDVWVPADVVISTVPAAVAGDLATRLVAAAPVIFDVLYDPWPTPLMAAAQAANRTVLTGRDLLIAQAQGQILEMTGQFCPAAVLCQALVTD